MHAIADRAEPAGQGIDDIIQPIPNDVRTVAVSRAFMA